MISRQADLRREIREHDWKAGGLGEAATQASLGEVSAALAESGQTLVGILARTGEMVAVVVRRGSARLVPLGDFEAAAEAAKRLNADLDTLAGRRLPTRLEAVIKESIGHQAHTLTAEIIAPLRSLLGDDGIVFVPAGPLASVPWGVLPGLRGRPVSVCPSASSWLAAWRRGHAEAMPSGSPLLVAGPDLEHAAREVTEIAKSYPGCRPLLPDSATVGAALRALDGAPLAHLAAHGYHDQENFLFSRIDLADGPLMAYDIQQLTAAPRHVVLSSCDVGRTVVRPGRGDPRLHRGPALHRHRDGDLQRHPGGRRRRRRHHDRLPPPARRRDEARRGARRGHRHRAIQPVRVLRRRLARAAELADVRHGNTGPARNKLGEMGQVGSDD